MARVLEKVERRLGEKLLLKGTRCLGPKCATVRRAYAPGAHGKKKGGRRRRGGSEFGALLSEKQKVRYLYGLDDREVERYSKKAASMSGVFSSNFLELLETRLDNTLFRLGLTESRRIARQVVGHRHVTVNGKTVNIPSYRVRKGDVIALKERIVASPLFSELDARLKNYVPPAWLNLNPSQKKGEVVKMPEAEDAAITVDVTKVKEFYSR